MYVMQRLLVFLFFFFILNASCNKDSSQPNLAGQWIWTVQYADNPAYDSTPQSTGIEETLSFTTDGNYSLTQNGVVTNSGTYKTSTAKNTSGQNIPDILYTNTRVTDSVAYYSLENKNDSLFFTYDLIGTVGSGSRHYGRQ
jgi:hypothetical protein